MGATPLHYTLCLTIPESDQDWLEAFACALRRESEKYGCSLIGGDTTRGELCISLQMLGTIEQSTALKRSAAKVGDDIWLTGNLGDAAGYVASNFLAESLSGSFWFPEPRLQFAKTAKQYIHGCIDISDGLMADLGHICSASNVAAKLELVEIPVSENLLAAMPDQAQQLALTGGDDYELCFTASPDVKKQLKEIAVAEGLRLSQIGSIHSGSGVSCLNPQGLVMPIDTAGYSHF
jgi:thiamine-monophosphate kinase